MKKRILILLSLFFITGCSCEYDLKIENNKFKETVIINSNDASEVNSFNQKWEVPIDKDDYNLGLDPSSTNINYDNIYNYSLSSNSLKFNYDFTIGNYSKSSAVSNCYERFNINYRGNTTVLSTSTKANCFDKYPSLTSVTVNITTDMEMKSNNADSVNGNTYTWNITKDNASNKPINMILISKEESSSTSTPDGNEIIDNNNNQSTRHKNDYSLYIFLGILAIVVLIGFGTVKVITKKDDNID